MFTNGREPIYRGTANFGGERWSMRVLTRAPKREEARMNPMVKKRMRLVRISFNREFARIPVGYGLSWRRRCRR
jgi:hypothetical protein